MLGGSWTQVAANFEAIADRDQQHPHLPWGKIFDDFGNAIFVTSAEWEYPGKLYVALVQCILRQLQRQNVTLLPESLSETQGIRYFEMQSARIAAFRQSRKTKVPPMLPESASVGVFYVFHASHVSAPLLSELKSSCAVYNCEGQQLQVPVNSHFLRQSACATPPSFMGVACSGVQCFEVAFGLPWNLESFISKAALLGHPSNFCKMIPADIERAVSLHVSSSAEEISEMRLAWSKRCLKRAAELDRDEKAQALSRPSATARKRVLLTNEILQSINYEDMGVMDLLGAGSCLAGDVPSSPVFEPSYKPCLSTNQS